MSTHLGWKSSSRLNIEFMDFREHFLNGKSRPSNFTDVCNQCQFSMLYVFWFMQYSFMWTISWAFWAFVARLSYIRHPRCHLYRRRLGGLAQLCCANDTVDPKMCRECELENHWVYLLHNVEENLALESNLAQLRVAMTLHCRSQTFYLTLKSSGLHEKINCVEVFIIEKASIWQE